MIAEIKDINQNTMNEIKNIFKSLKFDCIYITKDEVEFFKRMSHVDNYPRIHIKALKFGNEIAIYSHIDYKVHSGQVVLYNEDILAVNIILKKVLKNNGYTVTTFRNSSKKKFDSKKYSVFCQNVHAGEY